MSVEIDNYNSGVNSDITIQTAPRSISPAIVGGKFTGLANIVEAFRVGLRTDVDAANSAAAAAQSAVDAIELILGDGSDDAGTAVDKLREALVILQNFSEGADVAGMINNKVDKVAGKSLLSDLEITRLGTLVNYAHPTGDGNLHVPATGTTNDGKFLKAGSTAGSLAWSAITLAMDSVTGLVAALGLKANADEVILADENGRLPITALPDTIPLENIEADNLLDKFNPLHVYPYDTGEVDSEAQPIFKIGINYGGDSVRILRLLGFPIKAETVISKYHEASARDLVDNQTIFSYLEIHEETIVNEILFYLRTVGNYVTEAGNNLSLYTVDLDTKIATLVANTGEITTDYTTGTGLKRVALTAPYTAQPGLYLIGFRFSAASTTAAPKVLGRGFDASSMATIETGFKISFQSGTNLAATVDMATATNSQTSVWGGIN